MWDSLSTPWQVCLDETGSQPALAVGSSLVETEIRIRGFLPSSVKDRRESVLPTGIQFGEQMAIDSQLANLRETHAPVEEGFDYLISHYSQA